MQDLCGANPTQEIEMLRHVEYTVPARAHDLWAIQIMYTRNRSTLNGIDHVDHDEGSGFSEV